MSETAAITGTQSHDAAKTPEKKNHLAPVSVSLNGEPILLEGLLGSSFGDLATDRHAALLSYPRLSHPANAGLKQQMVSGLQAKYGNVYVQRLLKSQAVQAKLTVNPPDDQYEQEADRVADAMTRAPVSRVQRETEEEELQAEPLSDVQRNKEEEEELQTKSAEGQPGVVSKDLEKNIDDARGAGHPLSDIAREPMEKAFGADFSGVRVHTDSEANTLAKQLGARAFTRGHDIFLGSGEYQPESDEGRKLLAHEMTHVVQQGATDVSGKPTDREVCPKILGRGADVLVGLQGLQRQITTPLKGYVKKKVKEGESAKFKVGKTNVVVNEDVKEQEDLPEGSAKTEFKPEFSYPDYDTDSSGKISKLKGSPKLTYTGQTLQDEEEVQTKPLASSITPLVQRQAEEEEEQKVEAKTVDGPLLQMIQRQAEEEKEEEVQAKSASTNALPSLGDESRTIQRVEAKAQNASGGKPAAKEPGDVGTDLSRETLNGQDGQRELQTKPTQGHVAGETPVSPATREADRLTHQLGTVDPITGRYVFFGEEGHQPIAQESGGLSSHGQAHVVQQAPSLSTAPKGKKAPGSQATPWARPVSSWKEVAEKDQISLPDLLSLAKSSLRLAILLDCVSDVATLSGEPWKPSAKPGTTWKEMPAGSSKDEHYREIDMDRRKKVVDAIANCRSMIKELNASDVGGQAALLPRVQASFYGLLNSASPYYTQMANISLLGKGAWEWTCNVTSLAMTLEALGVTAGDFKGDLGLLSAIAQCLDPGRFKTVADVTSLRMPDLLQLVVIYNQDTGKLLGEHQRGGQGSRPSKPFAGLVTEARNAARPRVSSTLDVFVEVAQQFKGVSVNYSGAGSAGTKELTASAKRTRAVKRLLKTKRRLAQIESQLAKLERQSHGGQARTASKLTEELEKRNSEREQLEGSIGKLSASLPATTSADNVKNYGLWAISTLRPLLDQGKQLVVNRPGHYVRLESVGVDGVLIDDPAFLGKQILLSWEEAYQEGFLRSWVVVSK